MGENPGTDGLQAEFFFPKKYILDQHFWSSTKIFKLIKSNHQNIDKRSRKNVDGNFHQKPKRYIQHGNKN